MNKLIVKLKQHTPLIHFQHEQEGATFRASEMKPKIDRFIVKNVFHNNFAECKKYLVGYDAAHEEKSLKKFNTDGYRALNYHLKITPQGEKSIIDDRNILKMFFGNMGDGHLEKKGIMYSEGVVLCFESVFCDLIDCIQRNICIFLQNTNFGTRQSKGYGSFYVDPTQTGIYIAPTLKYHFMVTGDLSAVFTTLNDFYCVLRAGINNQGLYIKSALFQYAKDYLRTQWDKKTIKQHFLTDIEKSREETEHRDSEAIFYTSPEPHYLIKELLGFSMLEKWLFYGFEVKKENDNIKRFQSPICFKPIQVANNRYVVYFNAFNIPEEMLGQTFNVSRTGGGNFDISTAEQFDIHHYLEYVFKNITIDSLCGKRDGDRAQQRFNELERIFKELKLEL